MSAHLFAPPAPWHRLIRAWFRGTFGRLELRRWKREARREVARIRSEATELGIVDRIDFVELETMIAAVGRRR